MARLAALLCAIVAAAATSVNAAAIDLSPREGVVPAVAGSPYNLITFFTNVNYGGQAVTFYDQKTTGCIEATAPFINAVSSVKLDRTDIACNLWSEATCKGAVGLTVNGAVPSLIPYGFNDKLKSYNCYST
ncbi:hypothetical protein C8F01DRAFT_1165293 [Mycena amicta]|nr:hypothetical protein C8F01DRAFT_1165293 [Mycena amicta]